MFLASGAGWSCSRNTGLGAKAEACCGYNTEEWRTSPHPIGRDKAMTCDDQEDLYFVADDASMGEVRIAPTNWNWDPMYLIGGIAPSCVYSNPVNDGECTVGATGRMGPGVGKSASDLGAPGMNPLNMFKIYEDPVVRHQDKYKGFLMFPVVSGSKGKTYRFNFGDDPTRPFAYQMPCGYEPLSNSELTHNPQPGDLAKAPRSTTDCWTCKGTCAQYDDAADGVCDGGGCLIDENDPDYQGPGSIGRGRCVSYASGAGEFDYRAHGMVDAYPDGSTKLNKHNLPAMGFNEAPLSCELEMMRDCDGTLGWNDCQAWIDGDMASVDEHYEICPAQNAWWETGPEKPRHPESWRDVGTKEPAPEGSKYASRWSGGTYECSGSDDWQFPLQKQGVCTEKWFKPWWPVNGTLHDCHSPGSFCPDLASDEVCIQHPAGYCYSRSALDMYNP